MTYSYKDLDGNEIIAKHVPCSPPYAVIKRADGEMIKLRGRYIKSWQPIMGASEFQSLMIGVGAVAA